MQYTKKGIPINCDPNLVDDLGFESNRNGLMRADRRVWPWELPQNWRTGENYPDARRASTHRWAWEFLKRNIEFINDVENLEPTQRRYGNAVRNGTLTNKLKRQNSLAIRELHDKWEIESESHACLFEDMNDLQAPDTPFYFKSGIVNRPHAVTVKGQFTNSGTDEYMYLFKELPNEVPIIFNWEWPIEPQIRAAKQYLKNNQKHIKFTSDGNGKPILSVRNHVTKFLGYLRVWDARKDGAKQSEIEELLADMLIEANGDVRKAVENAENAAARYVNEGHYRYILLGGTSPRSK